MADNTLADLIYKKYGAELVSGNIENPVTSRLNKFGASMGKMKSAFSPASRVAGSLGAFGRGLAGAKPQSIDDLYKLAMIKKIPITTANTDIAQQRERRLALSGQNQAFSQEQRLTAQLAPYLKTYSGALGFWNGMAQSYDQGLSVDPADVKTNNYIDQALVSGFAKLKDPNSVVMPAEYSAALAAQALPGRAKGFLTGILLGEGTLTPEERKKLMEASANLMQGHRATLSSAKYLAEKKAKTWNVKIENVIPPESEMGYLEGYEPEKFLGITTKQVTEEEAVPDKYKGLWE